MLKILSEIANSIIAVFQFLVNTITSLLDFFVHIPSYLGFITQSISLLPSILIPFAIASIAIYIFLFTVGKE